MQTHGSAKQNNQNKFLTVAKIESKSTRGLAVNARRSCVDIDAASYVFSVVGVAAEGADAAAMATKEEEDARLREEEEARSRGEGDAATAATAVRKEGIGDGAEVDGVALLQLRETAAAAAPRMPCKRRVPR